MARLRCRYMVTPAPSTVNAAWRRRRIYFCRTHLFLSFFFILFNIFLHVALQGLRI